MIKADINYIGLAFSVICVAISLDQENPMAAVAWANAVVLWTTQIVVEKTNVILKNIVKLHEQREDEMLNALAACEKREREKA